MSRAGKSIIGFAFYLMAVGAWLLLHPDSMLRLFGFPEPQDVWVHVLGMILLLLSFYYVLAARSDLTEFIRWTVYARASVIVFFVAFVVAGLSPPILLLFGVIDLGAAAWTWTALQADASTLEDAA